LNVGIADFNVIFGDQLRGLKNAEEISQTMRNHDGE
jgi:hypothetical protein